MEQGWRSAVVELALVDDVDVETRGPGDLVEEPGVGQEPRPPGALADGAAAACAVWQREDHVVSWAELDIAAGGVEHDPAAHAIRFWREFPDGVYPGWRMTRLRSRANPARPYIRHATPEPTVDQSAAG